VSSFDDAFTQLLGPEGGYTNDPKDRGNWTSGQIGVGELRGTKYGISAAAFPNIDIANLTVDGAKLLYQNHYWAPIRGDQLPPKVASVVFDMAVNQGIGEAGIILQRALGVAVDGAIGPQTVAAANAADLKKLMKDIAVRRILYYASLPTWSTYQHSWVDRTVGALVSALGA
jgi:lysozyme family protein